MSLTNPNTPVSQQDLQDFYHKLLPYMGGSFGMIANKFSKGNIYSTDEKMIGQWIDGKPLYQKVATDVTTESIDGKTDTSGVAKRVYKTITNSNAFSISLKSLQVKTNTSNNDGYLSIEKNGVEIFKAALITDTFTPISSIGIINCNANDTVIIYVGFYNSHSGCWFEVKGDCTTISIPLSDTEMLMVDGFNVCRYTKTTDSAISIGGDTDYSTEEKIVGTWVDGSPIYQKTIQETMPNASTLGTLVKKYVDVGESVSHFINISGFIAVDSGAQTITSVDMPINVANGTSLSLVRGIPNSGANGYKNKIEIGNATPVWNGDTVYITIQYIKTT